MKFDDHCSRTKERIGHEMPEVHKYLDQYFPLFRSTNHWLVLHHMKGVEKLVRMFGDNYGYEGRILVRQAVEGHIIDDMGTVYFEPVDMEHLFFELLGTDERELEHCLGLEFP
jgi:hypothetical protein